MKGNNGQNIVIIGCGNLAWHLAKYFSSAKFPVSVYNHRASKRLRDFKSQLKCAIYPDLKEITSSGTFYFICVSDKNISEVSKKIKNISSGAIVLHTSGGKSINALMNKTGSRGVFYPLQTFSKQDEVSWKRTPILIEAENGMALKKIRTIASGLSETVRMVNSADRAKYHLAAVLVNNFTNALYVAAHDLIKQEVKRGDFKLLVPLIDQTQAKLKRMGPRKAQTGPARRGDKEVMKEHLRLLSADKSLKKIYSEMSALIQKQNDAHA